MFTKQDMAERWLRDLVDNYCDVQPDLNEKHLPFGMRCDVYDMYMRWVLKISMYSIHFVTDTPEFEILVMVWCYGVCSHVQKMREAGEMEWKPLSRTHFYVMWTERMPDVKVCKVTRFQLTLLCILDKQT